MSDWETLDAWWCAAGEDELRLILWAAWDPIGMVPRDEYDRYIPRVWELLRNRAAKEEIAAQLGEWRTERMGLPPDPNRDLVVAWKLCDWVDPPGLDGFRPASLMA